MNAEWIKSPSAHRVLVHWADPRPAWLWSHDGAQLIWRNAAARSFTRQMKKPGGRMNAEAVPIKGQIARLIRLGAIGISSLSRIQLLVGGQAMSATCNCTPLEMAGGEVAMLLVGVDPIEAMQLQELDRTGEALFPGNWEYLFIDDGQVQGGSTRALRDFGPVIADRGLPENADTIEIDGDKFALTRFAANPQDGMLVLFEPVVSATNIDSVRAEDGLDADADLAQSDTGADEPPASAGPEAEPLLPLGLAEVPPAEIVASTEEWVEPLPDSDQSLSSLFDRLADDQGLYAVLTEKDEAFVAPAEPPEQMLVPTPIDISPEMPPEATTQPETPPEAVTQPDLIASVIDYADDPEDETDAVLWRVTGRGFVPLGQTESTQAEPGATADAPSDNEIVDQVSRYNFDELSRILTDLTDRPGNDLPTLAEEKPAPAAEETPSPRAAPAQSEGVINLNAETFILNRLPLGIMVFRDQQVLFANRALTDLLGHDSVESLRSAGIGTIFPDEGPAAAGPVTHLLRRDEVRQAVNARLQSITWQGRPALMLSASLAEARQGHAGGHEGAVRAFAELLADGREEGFVQTDRAGKITLVSGHGRVLLGRSESDLTDRPLSGLLAPQDVPTLQAFMEKPARYAETARPSVALKTAEDGVSLLLFAEGQAGIVTGYFGFLARRHAALSAPSADDLVEPSMLARLSRGVRQPLNTIVGFADLIQSSAFGAIENSRYVDYARDIKTAGTEIAVLVEEIDDFVRLKDGRYAPRRSDVDLGALLDSCMTRVRGQAGASRVLVRSAISERLPRIRADRASLGQAVLNLLASAVDQTPVGGSVILSAQWQDDGSIAVHVRDGALSMADMAERFVVFRDGLGKDGEHLQPVRSSVGLALTRSLLAVNACSLSVDPTIGVGTLFSLVIPAELIVQH